MSGHAKQIIVAPEALDLSQKQSRPAPQLIGGDADAVESPVHDLQSRVALGMTAPPKAWSARRTLVVITATCGVFWAAVLYALFS